MLTQPIDSVDLVVVDVETTGLDPKLGDRVCEIGAIRWNGGREVDRFHSMVNPERSIPPDASRINGITADMVQDAPVAAEIMPAFTSFVGEGVFAAYNAPFDLGFLRAELAHAGLHAPSWTVIDVLALARHLLPSLPSHKLVSVARELGVADGQVHRALEDVEITGRVLHRFLGQLKAHGIDMVWEVVHLTRDSRPGGSRRRRSGRRKR